MTPEQKLAAQALRDLAIEHIEDLHSRHRPSFSVLWTQCAGERCRRTKQAVENWDRESEGSIPRSAPPDDFGLTETERRHSAACRAQEAQREREAQKLVPRSAPPPQIATIGTDEGSVHRIRKAAEQIANLAAPALPGATSPPQDDWKAAKYGADASLCVCGHPYNHHHFGHACLDSNIQRPQASCWCNVFRQPLEARAHFGGGDSAAHEAGATSPDRTTDEGGK